MARVGLQGVAEIQGVQGVAGVHGVQEFEFVRLLFIDAKRAGGTGLAE
jgi:hypothetical protein